MPPTYRHHSCNLSTRENEKNEKKKKKWLVGYWLLVVGWYENENENVKVNHNGDDDANYIGKGIARRFPIRWRIRR